MAGTRVAIESGQTRFHGWDEHTQVYFEGGWVHAHSPVLFANPGQPKVEIYEGGETPGVPLSGPAALRRLALPRGGRALPRARSAPASRSARPGTDALADVTLLEAIYRKHLGL